MFTGNLPVSLLFVPPFASVSNFSCKSDSADMTRHFPFNTELWGSNQISFSEIYCFGSHAAHKRFHLRFFIWYWRMKILSASWCEPLFISALKAPSCALLLLVRAEVCWSDQPHTGLLAACLLLHSVTLHQHCAYNVITAVGIGSRRASECKHITMRHKCVLS